MIWQDFVFTTGSLFFTLALLPTLFNKQAQVPRWTSVTKVVFLTTFVVAYASLGFVFSAWTTIVLVLTWTAVALWRPVR